ncbi:hypothetical protein OH77DRAFT_1157042 [Trametes cingulata]|nr:hypothetical protein OH77DRAFT_1157042 [Trametes cingulata]
MTSDGGIVSPVPSSALPPACSRTAWCTGGEVRPTKTAARKLAAGQAMEALWDSQDTQRYQQDTRSIVHAFPALLAHAIQRVRGRRLGLQDSGGRDGPVCNIEEILPPTSPALRGLEFGLVEYYGVRILNAILTSDRSFYIISLLALGEEPVSFPVKAALVSSMAPARCRAVNICHVCVQSRCLLRAVRCPVDAIALSDRTHDSDLYGMATRSPPCCPRQPILSRFSNHTPDFPGPRCSSCNPRLYPHCSHLPSPRNQDASLANSPCFLEGECCMYYLSSCLASHGRRSRTVPPLLLFSEYLAPFLAEICMSHASCTYAWCPGNQLLAPVPRIVISAECRGRLSPP